MIKKTFALLLIVLACCLIISGAGFGENDQDQEPTEAFSPGFYYTIQKGDTLWDLSKKFYDSEWVWPALWGQNEKIKNPHLIYPGNRIRLYQKADLLKAQDSPIPVQETAIVIEEETLMEEAPVEEAAPAPEPEPAVEEETPAPATASPAPVYYFMDEIMRVGFLKKLPKTGFFKETTDPLKLGGIFKVEGKDDQVMISQGDTVYVQPHEGTPFIIGSRYFVYKPLKKIHDKATGEYVGHQYRIAGVAEVTATSPDYAVADIIKSYWPINVGDNLMPLQKRSPEIALSPEPAGLTGHVIVDEDHVTMSSENGIVFLNKGEKDGVMPGQRYNIYDQGKKKLNGKIVDLPPVLYGKLLILLTQNSTATAIITHSQKAIHAGATFASPAL
jgi:LysM repeat protein